MKIIRKDFFWIIILATVVITVMLFVIPFSVYSSQYK